MTNHSHARSNSRACFSAFPGLLSWRTLRSRILVGLLPLLVIVLTAQTTEAQLIDTSWTCPGATCPASFRWDWVETTVDVFPPGYFTDSDHCESVDGIDSHYNHLDLVAPSHYQGGCGNCVLAATVSAMETQHRINLINSNYNAIMPAGVSFSPGSGSKNYLKIKHDDDPDIDPYLADLYDLEEQIWFTRQHNDISQMSIQYPMDHNAGSSLQMCEPGTQQDFEDIVNDTVAITLKSHSA